VRGALLPAGVYNPGWFDFRADKYQYINVAGDCDAQLCISTGFYPSNYCGVTTATQITTGFNDSAGCSPSPFSRFFSSYVGDLRPPYVDGAAAFVGQGETNGAWAGKIAVKKVPFPSQNFFGPCGTQQTVYLKDAVTCQPTTNLRWPNAVASCTSPWNTGAPKGDFVLVEQFIDLYHPERNTKTATDANVVPTSQTNGIIFIAPAGSIEFGKWPTRTTFKHEISTATLPGQQRRSAANQYMTDRFWTHVQDELGPVDDGMGGFVCGDLANEADAPLVEARVTPPAGAPYRFDGTGGSYGDNIREQPLSPNNFSATYDAACALTAKFSAKKYDSWPSSGAPDSASTSTKDTPLASDLGGLGNASDL